MTDQTCMETKSILRSSWFCFALLLIPGILLRLFHLADFSALPMLSQVIGPDVSEYHRHALRILSGEYLPASVPIHAPLYAWFWAFLLGLTGGELFSARLIQSVLLLIFTTLPVFLLLRNETSGPPSRRFACCTVLLLGLYPPLAGYQCELISEPLMIVASLWGLFFAAHGFSCRNLFLSGIFCALALLTHPVSIVFCGCLFLFLILSGRKESKKTCLTALGCFLLPFFLLVLPVSAWNTVLAKRPVFIQANSAFNYYLGNNPAANGTCYVPPGISWEQMHAGADAEAKRRGISTDSYFMGQTFHYIFRFPQHFLALLGRKACMALNGYELTTWSDLASLKLLFLHRFLSDRMFSILALFGIPALFCGLISPDFRRRMKWWILFFGSFWLSQILFLTAGRYRLPLVIPLCVFTVFFFVHIRDYFRTSRRSACFLACALLTGIITFWPLARPSAKERSYARTILAESWLRAGHPENVAKVFGDGPSEDSLFDDRRYNLSGEAALAQGDSASAAAFFRKAVEHAPQQYSGYLNCGTLLLDQNRPAEAEPWFEKARDRVRDAEGMALVNYNFGRLRQLQGRGADAAEYYRKTLAQDPLHRKALNNLGTLMLSERNYPEAIRLFRTALNLEPGNENLSLNLSVAYFLGGRKEDALQLLRALLRTHPGSKKAAYLLKEFSAG